MNMVRQCSVVLLVGAVIQCLEDLRIQEADQEIKRCVIVRDHSIKGTLFLPQGVQIHIIMVCKRLDLGQIERGKPDRR